MSFCLICALSWLSSCDTLPDMPNVREYNPPPVAEPTMICKEARVRKRYRPDVRVGIVGWGAPGHVSAIWGKQVERAIHVGIVRHCEANGHDVASLRLKGPFMFGS